MADEEVTDIEEPKKSKKGLIIIIVVVINVLALGGGFFVLSGGDKKEDDKAASKSAKPERKAKDPGAEDGPIVDLDGFVVNLDTEEGAKYLKAKVSVQLHTPEDVDPFTKSQSLVRNELLLQLSSIDLDSIKTVKGKRKLEKKLTKAVNKRMGQDLVTGVFFVEFVTQ